MILAAEFHIGRLIGRIHTVDLYRKVRLACRDGMSERAAARHVGVSRQSVRKMLQFSVPAGLRTHGAGAPSEARRVYRADRAVAWGRSPQRLFKHWPAIFNHDATLTSAGLDRLLHHPRDCHS